MYIKKLLPLCLISCTAWSVPVKLVSYQHIYQSLLKGYTVKAIVDLKNNCTVIADSTAPNAPKTSLNIFSITLQDFVIKELSKDIVFGVNALNSPYKQIPANYTDTAIAVTSQGQVNLTLSIVEFPQFRNIKTSTYICNIGDAEQPGVIFYQL